MGKEYVMKAVKDIEELAKKEGLDFFPTIFEFVNKDIMLEACSYGLPVRARHWSYGRSYDHQKIYGEMGLSKVYEIVFNNDPSYAFLLNTNLDVINIMVAAHVFGHCHFFKHNVMFKGSDRNMVYKAAERAARVDDYVEQYGLEKIEHLMDIGFALDNHIDWHKGLYRRRYPARHIVEEKRYRDEFDDLLNINNNKRSIRYRTVGDKLPPYPEKDLLWFLTNYAPLEEWEKDILGILRDESYYFYPIVQTKVMNEGFACVTPDTLVFSEDGMLQMKDVVEKRPSIYDGEQKQRVIFSGVFNDRETIKITTERGLVICGADNHRVLNNSNQWVQLNELSLGDAIKVSGGDNIWGKNYQKLNFTPKQKAQSTEKLCKKYGINYSTYYRYKYDEINTKPENVGIVNKIDEIVENEKEYTSSMGNRDCINIPSTLDEKLGRFLGYMIGDGHISTKGRMLGFTTGDNYSKDDFIYLINALFEKDVKARWDGSSKNGRWRINIYSKTLIDFMIECLGLCSGTVASKKSIPAAVLRSPKNVVSSFIRSYFDSDACASSKEGVILSTSSDELAKQTQTVLLNYGILSRRKKAKDGCWQLRITGKSAKTFYKEIGFRLDRKQKILEQYINNHKYWHKEKWEDKIANIEYCGKQDVYDISVENTHKYAAAGFINHNSFWHAELMFKYKGLNEEEHLEFCKCHASVVSPGHPFRINPYYLGFKVFTDIREKWDEKYKNGESSINGIQKVLEVAAEEDDASFLRNYLTADLAEKLGLFNFGYRHEREPGMDEDDLPEEYGIIELKDRELSKIIENIIRPTINFGAPLITINQVDGDTLILHHKDDFGPLDEKYTEKTMEYIYELWGGPVELRTYGDDSDPVAFIFDEAGFDIL